MNAPYRPSFVKPLDFGFVGWLEETNQYLLSENPFSDETMVPAYPHKSCVQLASVKAIRSTSQDVTSGRCQNVYQVGDHEVTVDFQNQKLHEVFGAGLRHLELRTKPSTELNYQFTIVDDTIRLFKNKSLIQEEPTYRYHYLQSLFANELIGAYNNVDRPDWLASFHASAVQMNDTALLLLGDSGSGKSTLAAILSASGFCCIADDLVLMRQSDSLIYPSPLGISVKAGSWQTLEHFYLNLKQIQNSSIQKKSQSIKYLPIHCRERPPTPMPCEHLVWVNFNPQSVFKIVPLTQFEALQKLIPDTWIAHSKENAKQFLNWFVRAKSWSLSYSNYKEVLCWFKNLTH